MAKRWATVIAAIWVLAASAADSDRLVIRGKNGAGKGKKVVLVSGAEEYRSGQALPQLAKILAARHGFDCTVLNPSRRCRNWRRFWRRGTDSIARCCSRSIPTTARSIRHATTTYRDSRRWIRRT